MCLQPVLSVAFLSLTPAEPWPSMLGEVGPTQHPSGAAQTSPGRGAPAMLEYCPCTIACVALSSPRHKRWLLPWRSSPIHITSWGTAAHPRDVTAVVGAELLQTLTFPNPWERELRPASWEENTGTTQAFGLLCSEQEKTNILLLN